MTRRVVVTGQGAVSPLGIGVSPMWDAMRAGRHGIAPIQQMDTEGFKVHLGCEVKDFDPAQYLERKEARRMDRFCQFAVIAADEAIAQAGFDMENENPERFAVLVGSGIGGLYTTETESVRLRDRGPAKVAPLLVPMMIVNMAPGLIAMRHGLKGPCTSVVTACATGTNAIGDAFRMIKHGYADVCVTGGAEATITPLGIAGFTQIQAMTERTNPDRASIPFDKERDGFVIGEGAGMVVLEEYDRAVARGATILGEVLGYGSTCDAYHMTAPDPEGAGAANAMRLAIEESGASPRDIGYINAHGTSTPPNDRVETIAIKKVFGEYAEKIAVSSTKSMTGHMLGAAGAVEAIVCLMAMRDGFIPPTIGLMAPDPQCDLDYVPGKGRSAAVDYSLSNSMGFGGHNAALLFGRGK